MTRYSHKTRTCSWPMSGALFPSLNADVLEILNIFPQILAKVWPLAPRHKKSLPEDIKNLSLILTSHRYELRHSYWKHPAFISAYLYYFLPWNIIRLARLFSGLPLPEPDWKKDEPPLLIDAGSGPLTLPLALWLTKKTWRDKDLYIVALDSNRQILDLGKKIFLALSALSGQTAWSIKTVCAPAHSLLSYKEAFTKKTIPWLVSASNVLNELRQNERGRHNRFRDAIDNSIEDIDCGEPLQPLLHSWMPLWERDGFQNFLFVEPGGRLGGDTIMQLRQNLLECGLNVVAPCTHNNACPLINSPCMRHKYSSLANAWCHFTYAAQDIPEWLLELSTLAGINKKSLALSFLLTGTMADLPQFENFTPLRVLSRPFKVPNYSGEARYACCADGLAMLADSRKLPSGSLTLAKILSKQEYDRKSGAIIINAPDKSQIA